MTIELITDLLRKRNVKADSACNGSKAIELAEERVRKVGRDQADMYSLILLDHNLPELDGPKIAKEIRKRCKESLKVGEQQEHAMPYICSSTS